jgi:hypothetical protein
MNMSPIRRRSEDDAFWQRLVLPEEERRWIRDWDGSYRWFRSSNVVCLEHYRSPAEMARIRTVILGAKPPLPLITQQTD